MMLGRFLDKLNSFPATAPVRFDFCGFSPTDFGSYRGFYDQLALGFQMAEYGKEITVEQLAELASKAVGKVFTGYKGGDYVMHRGTALWVANYGECWSTAICGVRDREHEVIIETEYQP